MVLRCLFGFNSDEELVFDEIVENVTIEELHEVFGEDEEDPDMLEGDYIVSKEQLPFFEKLMGIKLDRALEYFFGACADPSEKQGG